MENDKKNAIKALLDKRQKANTATADLAKKWLIEEGMLTQEGELKPQYGGQIKRERED